jgi:ketosteroid isomerase-like protein
MLNDRFYKNVWLIAVFVFLAISVQAQNKLSKKDIKSIKEIKETYRISWLEDDSRTILSLFAEDATIYPNGLSPRVGKKALNDFWFTPSDSKTVITDYKIDLEEINGEKNLAFATGSTEIKWNTTHKNGDAKNYSSKGNFLTVFSKHNGKWEIIRHIWNGKFEEIKK